MKATPPPHRRPALVAVAHGSRDPEVRRTLTALSALALVRVLRPGPRVELAHIGLTAPPPARGPRAYDAAAAV